MKNGVWERSSGSRAGSFLGGDDAGDDDGEVVIYFYELHPLPVRGINCLKLLFFIVTQGVKV